MRPWVFVPESAVPSVTKLVEQFEPKGRCQALEETLPWKYENHVLSHEDWNAERVIPHSTMKIDAAIADVTVTDNVAKAKNRPPVFGVVGYIHIPADKVVMGNGP